MAPSNGEIVLPVTGTRFDAPRRWARAVLVATAFAVTYLLLDRLGTFNSVQGAEISPWEPVIPFLLAVVMEFGAPMLPVAVLLPWLAEVVNAGAHPLGFQALSALVTIGCVYAAAGLVLRRLFRQQDIHTTGGFSRLLLTLGTAALLCAVLSALALEHVGVLPAAALPAAVMDEWIDDFSIAVVVLPLYLLWRSPGGLQLPGRPRLPEVLLQGLAMALVFALNFDLLAPIEPQLFYLFFIPIAWLALRSGAAVTAIAVLLLQVGIVLVLARHGTEHTVAEIQLLLLLLASSGLFLAIAVSNTNRLARLVASRDEQLAWVNRSTGLMELNAAIAHELNNPLAAVSNYLRAATLLLERPSLDQPRVQDTVRKALGEASRAVEVLRELRAFYRGGTVRHEPLAPRRIVEDAVAGLQARLQQCGVACAVDVSGQLPRVNADATQLSVVLHNLLGNACDATRDRDAGRRSIAVRAEAAGDEVRFSVEDRGGGIEPELRAQLFRPLNSAKPAGMGLGLAICRALVEANGGRIWLERSDAQGTCIAFALPAWRCPAAEQTA